MTAYLLKARLPCRRGELDVVWRVPVWLATEGPSNNRRWHRPQLVAPCVVAPCAVGSTQQRQVADSGMLCRQRLHQVPHPLHMPAQWAAAPPPSNLLVSAGADVNAVHAGHYPAASHNRQVGWLQSRGGGREEAKPADVASALLLTRGAVKPNRRTRAAKGGGVPTACPILVFTCLSFT